MIYAVPLHLYLMLYAGLVHLQVGLKSTLCMVFDVFDFHSDEALNAAFGLLLFA